MPLAAAWFKPGRKAQAEKERKLREEENLRQAFFKLPAELRNEIYNMVMPTGQDIVKRHLHPRARGWQGGLPPLMQVCHQLREELFYLFYSTNVFTVCLTDFLLHPKSEQRRRSSVLLLPKEGTACLRMIKIESCGRCFHSGFARQPNVNAIVDRSQGTVVCQPRYSKFLEPCCKAAATRYSAKLSDEIRRSGFHDEKRKLRQTDFERLTRRMDEDKKDWPKASKRVVPRYYTT